MWTPSRWRRGRRLPSMTRSAHGSVGAYGPSSQVSCRCTALWSAPAESRMSGMATALWLEKGGGLRSP